MLACVAWLLGAGITVGEGSLVTMAASDAGLLPAIPIFGAVPPPTRDPPPTSGGCWSGPSPARWPPPS
ncbi:hypothetical protein G7085_16155 [Tessaracoccus sp. HDW20]|nr:hypothetical protein [Tessaracoccus coleopterorum]